MARRNSTDDIPEELVPISELAFRAGYPDVAVRNKLKESEIVERWDHTPCVRGKRATEILDELVAAREENNRWNRENIDRQLDAEREGRLAPYRAWQYEAAHSKGLVHGGVQAFGPDDPTPSWGEGARTSEGLRGTRR